MMVELRLLVKSEKGRIWTTHGLREGRRRTKVYHHHLALLSAFAVSDLLHRDWRPPYSGEEES